MKISRLLLSGLLVAPVAGHFAAAQTLDPTFAPPSMYAPGIVISAVEQPDGKRVITGLYNRVDGTPAWGVSRFDANGTLDATFQQNVGTGAYGYRLRLLSNGQFFVVYPGSSTSAPLVAGGISRLGALRLNADGTGDASFDPGTGPGDGGFIDDLLPLPGGKSIAVGAFDHFNGAVANAIVRLNTNGTVDATFNSGLGAADGDDIERIVALPNGQFLASGYISTYNGVPCNGGIIRLNADGSLDPTFISGAGFGSVVDNMTVQPDGRIIVASLLGGAAITPNIARLMPNGALDTSFTPPTFGDFSISSRYGDALQLQPDGKIIVLNSFPAAGSAMSSVVRLNTDGTLDPSFQVGTQANEQPSSVLLLANGKVLLMGGFTAFSGVLDRPLVQLTSTGAVDPAFQPVVQTTGSVAAVVRQADGKLVVGGSFSQINGQTARRLARFNTDGTLDATFIPPSLNTRVVDVALQADGRILAAQASEVHRYLATGQLDNTFTTPGFSGSSLTRLLLQADGRVLVGGPVLKTNGTTVPQGFLRLLDTGASDASFAPASGSAGGFVGFLAMTQQADGKLLVAGQVPSATGTSNVRTLMRLTSSGALDAGFSGGTFGDLATTSSSVQTLAVQPDGKILVGGAFSAYGATSLTNIARLNSDGTADAGFTAPTTTGTVNKLVLQPNNRILVGGSFTSSTLTTNLARLLANGAADATFTATAVPNSSVNALLVQPDGKLVAGGSFATWSAAPSMGVARLTVANVLAVAAPKAVADRTEAWPVPAHAELNVAFDASAHPQALDLTDVLGRPLLHQSLSGGTQATLPLGTVSAGTYLLRVTYAEGLVVRRVQVQ